MHVSSAENRGRKDKEMKEEKVIMSVVRICQELRTSPATFYSLWLQGKLPGVTREDHGLRIYYVHKSDIPALRKAVEQHVRRPQKRFQKRVLEDFLKVLKNEEGFEPRKETLEKLEAEIK